MAKSNKGGGRGKSVLQPKTKYPEANYWKTAKGSVPFVPGTKKEPAGNTNDKRPQGEG